MRKYALFPLILLLLIPFASSQDDWFMKSLDAEIDFSVSGTLRFFPTDNDYDIKYIQANLSFFPKEDFRQKRADMTIYPKQEFMDDEKIIFKWSEPVQRSLDFSVSSIVLTKNERFRIPGRLKFPIAEVPEYIKEYTKPSPFIDSDNRKIIALSSSLAQGEDDLFIVVNKFAAWTNENVNYNLSTLTAETTQKSSWVLETRQGVCDEITNLFIALARSQNIPARFVSGIAYTNSDQFDDHWGPHGWAEVYFPGYGWIPFDPTYGQYGFVDSSHIKLKEHLDSSDSATAYEWFGYNTKVVAEKLNYTTRLISKGEDDPGYVFLKIKPKYGNVGFGSFNMIEVEVENFNNFYVAEELFLSEVEDLEIIGNSRKTVFLKPYEKKNVFWTVKVSPLLDRGYQYTFPIQVTTHTEQSAKSSFKSTAKDEIFDYKNIEEPEVKTYTSDLDIKCDARKAAYYDDEEIEVECVMTNTGNKVLENIEVCMLNRCQKSSLYLSESSRMIFVLGKLHAGKISAEVEASNPYISKKTSVLLIVEDYPKIELSGIDYPVEVDYDKPFNITFNLERKSVSFPQDAKIKVVYKGEQLEYEIREFYGKKPVELFFPAADFMSRENEMKLELSYSDRNGIRYNEEKSFNIKVGKINLWIMIKIFFVQLLG